MTILSYKEKLNVELKNKINSTRYLYKWLPRKSEVAVKLRDALGMTPKQYRKALVESTKVVETQMCAKQWHDINYEHVPSVAAARYQKAFTKHDESRYQAYRDSLTKGEAKINASAVYPYDVLKSVLHGDPKVADAQWKSLPNYLGDQKILPMVDVSGSMTCPVPGNKNLTCMMVALSLGLYLADKNSGPFKDSFLTFSRSPELIRLRGTLSEKIFQMNTSRWAMDTNLEKAFKEILKVAVSNNLSLEDMPDYLLILSDMQFNACVSGDRAFSMASKMYKEAGYDLPKIVFWNLNAVYSNVPVTFRDGGTALVSGFSPALMKSILKAEKFDPVSIMMETVMSERYNH